MTKAPGSIPAIKVHQWLDYWNDTTIQYDQSMHRRKPEECFYIFSLSANQLRRLSGIQRRTTKDQRKRVHDLNIQRRHDVSRSDQIREYVRYGFPWSDLTKSKRESGQFDDLRKPGWLPTSIVVNILRPDDEREGKKVAKEDLISINEKQVTTVNLPESFREDWHPNSNGLHPIEIIDGQHRLFAFDSSTQKELDSFQLPVVAFYGLDISWQAYLFWTINIKPKKINASLAFDLYPLLRAEDWLEKFEGHPIYREVRSQELTEALWAHPKSPWYQRINMLGEPGIKSVTQAAWIRSLMATYVKSWESKRESIGGIFGAPIGSNETVLAWSGAQQAALLIFIWNELREAIAKVKGGWTKYLRGEQLAIDNELDLAFAGSNTLLNTDQGVRGILFMFNDLLYLQHKNNSIDLQAWFVEKGGIATEEKDVDEALSVLNKQKKLNTFVKELAEALASFDWRTSSASGLNDKEKQLKLVFRGSSGYRELRRVLLQHLSDTKGEVGKTAREAYSTLFEKN